MPERFTPSEHMEAQDKKEQHDKGREEAKFYRQLLDNFYRKIINQAARTDLNKELGQVDLNTTDLKLKQFKFCDVASMQTYMKEAADSVAQALGMKNFNLSFEVNSLAEMTPSELHQHIENQKSSLIKD